MKTHPATEESNSAAGEREITCWLAYVIVAVVVAERPVSHFAGAAPPPETPDAPCRTRRASASAWSSPSFPGGGGGGGRAIRPLGDFTPSFVSLR